LSAQRRGSRGEAQRRDHVRRKVSNSAAPESSQHGSGARSGEGTDRSDDLYSDRREVGERLFDFIDRLAECPTIRPDLVVRPDWALRASTVRIAGIRRSGAPRAGDERPFRCVIHDVGRTSTELAEPQGRPLSHSSTHLDVGSGERSRIARTQVAMAPAPPSRGRRAPHR